MRTKSAFLRTSSVITLDETEVVIKWDQIRLSIVPVSEWTMEKGAKQVQNDGKDDKR